MSEELDETNPEQQPGEEEIPPEPKNILKPDLLIQGLS